MFLLIYTRKIYLYYANKFCAYFIVLRIQKPLFSTFYYCGVVTIKINSANRLVRRA